MKFIFLVAGMLFFSSLVWSQAYTISTDELKNNKLDKREVFSINQSKDNWQDNAFILFTKVGGDVDKIKVTFKGDSSKVIQERDTSKSDKLTVSLVEAINSDISAFDIYFNDKKIGEVSVDVEKKDAPVTPPKKPNSDSSSSSFTSYVGALANANFIGNNKFLSNLTPIVNLGGIVTLKQKGIFSWCLDINPYVGGEIDTKDSASFIPALMLYGRGGFVLNNYLNLDWDKVHLTFMPAGFGLKFIPNLQDSGHTVTQHNLRAGIALRYDNDFTLSAHITQGWHNLTSQSKENYQKTFTNKATDITYLTVALQMALRGKSEDVTNYIYFEWRGLLSKKSYEAFTNNTILTIGLRKTLELSGGKGAGSSSFRAANTRSDKNGRSFPVVHQNL